MSPRRRVRTADLIAQHRPVLIAVGDALAAKRRARKLTQRELAERCGLQRAYVSAVEQGRKNPTLITLYLMAEELDWSLLGVMRAADV